MGHTVLVIAAAAIIGAVVLGIFSLGVWWGAKRRAEFFQDRDSLLGRDKNGLLQNSHIKSAHCVWLVGRKAFASGEHLEKIKQLILPNPYSESVLSFETSLPDQLTIQNEILEVTRIAINKSITVKWYPEFTGQSWWIANRDSADAFIHIEVLLPYSLRDRRPSFRIHRWQSEAFYQQYCEIFDSLWNSSQAPDFERGEP